MCTDITSLVVCKLLPLITATAVVLRHFLLGAGYALNLGSLSSPIPEMYKRLVVARHDGPASGSSRG